MSENLTFSASPKGEKLKQNAWFPYFLGEGLGNFYDTFTFSIPSLILDGHFFAVSHATRGKFFLREATHTCTIM